MRKNSRFNRFVSAMLALIMVVGLIPANIIPTRAEDSAPSKMTYDGEYNAAIKRYKTSVDIWKKTGYKDGTVGIHLYSLKGGGLTQPAFCMERGVNEPSEGSVMTLKWSKSSRDPSIVSYGWLLDWWYYHYYRGDFDDGQGSGMNSWNAQLSQVYVQAAIWLHQQDGINVTFTEDMDCESAEWQKQVEHLVLERQTVLKTWGCVGRLLTSS